ncbi:hypothetical protein GJAV_G00147700 [Gymnothorax javanicus]|nr:hypothetical protein GJAV_G00147700 [Gymnothorax javanicus]
MDPHDAELQRQRQQIQHLTAALAAQQTTATGSTGLPYPPAGAAASPPPEHATILCKSWIETTIYIVLWLNAHWLIVASKMKPRKLLLSVDLLPTISEKHEDASQVRLPGHSTQSLEEYFASIKELAQPATSSACAPLWEQRSPRPRLASFPPPKQRSPAPSPHIIPRPANPTSL